MATYSSYKKIYASDSMTNNIVTDAKLAQGARRQFGVKWVFGNVCHCTTGCCCAWVVPSEVRRLHIEIWGAGGNGHGACSCNRCHHYQGASGGAYNAVDIATVPGCTYTACAGGVYRCRSRDCTACNGCTSYVNGQNLSDFCAIGGCTGVAETSWSTACNQTWGCCLDKGDNNGSFGFTNHASPWGSTWFRYNVGNCHCYRQWTTPGPAAGIGTDVWQAIGYCYIRCGFACVPYGHGGQGAMSTYCNCNCCGQGGTGGSGLVKISYW